MIYDMALVAVALGAGYWGQHFLRTRPHGTPTFGLMLLGAALLCLAGMYGRHSGGGALSLAGAIGIGTGLCLLVVGPFLTAIARRLAMADRPGIAMRLFELADVVAPGAGAGDEKAMLRAMLDIRAGKIDPTIAALTAAKGHAPEQAKTAIDERIVMLYLAAHRWREGIAHAEATLALDGDVTTSDPVWVELLGAYGREGDLARAGRMAARLETALEGEPRRAIWRHRGRLAFLALAGRVDAVKALVVPKVSPHMSPGARTYWLAVALDRHGEHGAARTAYEKARAQSKGRGKDLVGDALEKLPATDGAPVVLDEDTAAIADRLAAAPMPVPLRTRGLSWATPVLIGSLVATYAVVRLTVGDPGDLGVLARSGAAVHELVAGGEWWRLVSCVFVHMGVWHLIINGVGLFFLGRLAETLFGGARLVAIFAVAAVAGSVASYVTTTSGVFAGAGAGVFGVLGALFIELTVHRARYRQLNGRALLLPLALIIVVQLAWDAGSNPGGPWANGGGLAAGVLAGLALASQRAPALGTWLARGVGVAFGAVAILSAVLVARTPLAESLAHFAMRPTELGTQIVVDAPASWYQSVTTVEQPDTLIELRAIVIADPAKWLVTEQNGLRIASTANTDDKGAPIDEPPDSDDVAWTQRAATDPLVAIPPGWEAQELAASFDTTLGSRQHLRVVLAWRRFGVVTVGVRILASEVVAREAGPFLTSLLASVAIR